MGIKIIGKFRGVPRNTIEQIALQLSLDPKQREKLQRDAIGMVRGKGAPQKKQIRALAEKYTAEGDEPHTVARKIRSEIGGTYGTYTAKNVRELLRYKPTK